MKSNYHTHVKLCGHAVGMVEDYVLSAIKNGYKSLGMSDHGPIKPNMMSKEDYVKNWLDRQMTYDIYKNTYLPDFFNSKEKYGDKIKLYVGVEIEYIPEYHEYFAMLRKDLDYMNLAMHFFFHNNEVVNGFSEVTYDNVLSYAKSAVVAMESGLYNILVHPDVFMHEYMDKTGSNRWDERCEEASKMIIESAIKNNVYLEINCGGLYKVTAAGAVPGEYGYPRRQFWEIASKYKELKVVIGVDAHDPKQLNAKEIEDAKNFANKVRIKVLDYCDTIEK